MKERQGRKWIGYVLAEVLLVIPILVLLLVMGNFVEQEKQRQRLEQTESSDVFSQQNGGEWVPGNEADSGL